MNGDGLLDAFEIEALFQREVDLVLIILVPLTKDVSDFSIEKLDKVYNTSDPSYDPEERVEEMNRMREHVMREMDKNGDHIISLDEFMKGTEKKEFEENEEWKVS